MARVSDVLVESLLNQGSNLGFGVPGESYLAVLDAFYDRAEAFQFVTCRHEGGAGFMAEAYGKLTGRPGLCFVTRGPGATNAAIAVHTAYQNSTPMIVFVGQINSGDRDREAFQELDYRQVFGGIAKWVSELDNPDRAPELVRRAYNVALTGRPGPVVIALPENVLRMDCSNPAAKPVRIARPRADEMAISDAQNLFVTAKKPLVIAGGGGWTENDRAALDEFARRNSVPVMTAFRCQDLIDYQLPNFIGDAGVGMPASSKAALREADLLVAINVRFGEMLTDAWSLLEARSEMPKIVHVHLDPSELNKIYHADVAITGTPKDVLNGLHTDKEVENWADEHRQAFFDLRHIKTDAAVSMAELCQALNKDLPADAVITNGAGNFAAWPSRHIDLGAGRRLIAPQSGAMGVGIPAAISAKLLEPNRHVVCFAGDGDAQMTMNELATAAQYHAKPNVVLLNNGSLGTIEMHQKRDFPGRRSGTELINPDFQKLAEGYGFQYELIETADAIEPAIEPLSKKQGYVVEVRNYG